MASPESRPWNYRLVASLQLTDSELEALADRLVPSNISIAYAPIEGRAIFRGWTYRTPAWTNFTFIEGTIRDLFPAKDVAWLSAWMGEGQTDAEVEADLERMVA